MARLRENRIKTLSVALLQTITPSNRCLSCVSSFNRMGFGIERLNQLYLSCLNGFVHSTSSPYLTLDQGSLVIADDNQPQQHQ